jgi:hypothetical protein
MVEPKTPNLADWYNLRLEDHELNNFGFRFSLLRQGNLNDLPITRYVESCEWGEEEEAQQGTLVLRRPTDTASLPIERGQTVLSEVKFRGTWYELWRMNLKPFAVVVEEAQITAEMVDTFGRLGTHTHSYKLRRRDPYYAHEVTAIIARKEGIAVGRLAKATGRKFDGFDYVGSPIGAVLTAYLREKAVTGRSYVVRMHLGKLEVLPVTERNLTINVLRSQVETATTTYEGPEETSTHAPVTVIYAKGVIGKGKSARKVTHTVFDKATVDKLGYRRKDKDYGSVQSQDSMVDAAKRELAAGLKIKTTMEVTHPGIPFLRRGDGIRVNLFPDEYSTHAATYMYVASILQRVEGNDYNMALALTSEDPFVAAVIAEAKKRKEIAEKAKEKKK